MKSCKFILSITILLAIFIGLSLNVCFADCITCKDVVKESKKNEILEGRKRPTADDMWDFSQGVYNAVLELVGKHKLYTNSSFFANADGKIYVDYTMASKVKLKKDEETYCYIGIYDAYLTEYENKMTKDEKRVALNNDFKSGKVCFENLKRGHRYIIYFRSYPKAVKGSAVVKWSKE